MEERADPSAESAGEEITRIYRDSCKEHDILWNLYVARPLASVLVYLLRRTPVTPNQVTFLGAGLFLGVAAALIGVRGWAGMLLAAGFLELSYLFDCADGQLARLTSMTSDVGAYLDFLVDEVKALILVGASGIRVWLEGGGASGGRPFWLLVTVGGVVLVAIATSLTTFVRREAYAGGEIEPGASARRAEMPDGAVAAAIWAGRRLASFLVHYPSWYVAVALADGLSGFDGTRWFLYLFLGVYVVYAGKTGVAVLWKLGRPSFYEEAD